MGNYIFKGQPIETTPEQEAAIVERKKNEIAFIVDDDDKVLYSVGETRSQREWVREDLGFDDDVFENMKRGLIRKGDNYAVISMTSHYHEVPASEITSTLISNLGVLAKEEYGIDELKVYNGFEVGEVGETWTPKTLVATVKGDDILWEA